MTASVSPNGTTALRASTSKELSQARRVLLRSIWLRPGTLELLRAAGLDRDRHFDSVIDRRIYDALAACYSEHPVVDGPVLVEPDGASPDPSEDHHQPPSETALRLRLGAYADDLTTVADTRLHIVSGSGAAQLLEEIDAQLRLRDADNAKRAVRAALEGNDPVATAEAVERWRMQREAAAHGVSPSVAWVPSVADPISGFKHLSKCATLDAAHYHKLAAQPPVYVWQTILIAGTILGIAGPPGSGKTTLVYLYIAARAARTGAGTDLLGKLVYPAPQYQSIVVIEGEHGEASAARKLLRSLELLGIDSSALDGGRVITIARKNVTIGSEAWQEIEQLIAAGLVSDIVLDTMARVAPADANKEQEQVAIFERVAQAMERAPKDVTPPVAIALMHERKRPNGDSDARAPDPNNVSGSSQRVGQVDSLIQVAAVKNETGQVIASRAAVTKLREDPIGGDTYPQAHEFEIVGRELKQSLMQLTAAPHTKGSEEIMKLEQATLAYVAACPGTSMRGIRDNVSGLRTAEWPGFLNRLVSEKKLELAGRGYRVPGSAPNAS